jgi:hypothetical protein
MPAHEHFGVKDDLPKPTIDPPEPPRPDELHTWSPGMTDESGELPVSDDELGNADAGSATVDPTTG